MVARRTAVEGGGETPPANVRLRLIYQPHFRLPPTAPADTFAAGSAFRLAASDGVVVAAVALFEPDDLVSANVVAVPDAGGVAVMVQPCTTAGRRRIVATAAGDGLVAQRTIRVT